MLRFCSAPRPSRSRNEPLEHAAGVGWGSARARDIPVPLDFLGSGRWKMKLWKDAADSGVNAEHLEVEEREVTPADNLVLELSAAGGAVARFQPL